MKTFRKTTSILLAVLMLLSACAVSAFAADAGISVTLRVEGLKDCLFYDTLTLAEGANVLEALQAADAASDSLTLTVTESQYGAYLQAINGLEAGSMTAKQWDGWMYHVNDADPGVGMTECALQDKDSVVVFYSDEWNTGMAYPTVDLSRIAEGKIAFTTTVTTYDESYNPTTSTVNVKDYTLTWDGKTLTPDAEGVCTIPADALTNGEHAVQIEAYTENGLPTILRFAPDFTVTVSGVPEAQPETEPETEQQNENFFTKIVNFFRNLIRKIRDFFGKLFK